MIYIIWQNSIENLGPNEEATFYYKKDLDRMDAYDLKGPNMVGALMFLPLHRKSMKRFQEAEVYCNSLLEYTSSLSHLIFFRIIYM